MENGSPARVQDAVAPGGAGGPNERIGLVIRQKWRIDSLLGVGGMAAVYSATHVQNQRRTALKILHREYTRDPTVRDRFLREGYVGNKVPHPSRVEVLDNDETDEGEVFLVMELLEGETIDSMWKRNGRKLPVVDALNIAERLLDFLSACHGVGIVHRDLKPANVFITRDGILKVLDFGIAQLRDSTAEATRAGTALGTPSYMSPEQARGLGDQLDGRADIFSVGAMLYALVSGSRLHQGRSNDEALILAATQPAPSVARVAPELPVEAIGVIDKALAWDRRNRFGDAEEMRREVVRVLDLLGGDATASQGRAAGGGVVTIGRDAEGSARSGEEDGVVADDDPWLIRLRGLFRQFERALSGIRQYGKSHPETERKLRIAFDEVTATLAEDPASVSWTIGPYSVLHRGRDVWEPVAPFDGVPYSFFASGIRRIRLKSGIEEGELRALLELMLIDPDRDLPPEDDLSTMIWELGLSHVEVQALDSFAEGDAAQRERFIQEAEAIERLAAEAADAASRAEIRAMPVATEREALGSIDPWTASLALDGASRVALATQLALPVERWNERYVETLVDAYLETRRQGDVELVTQPLGRATADTISGGKLAAALAMHAQVMGATTARLSPADAQIVRGELTEAMFQGPSFDFALRALAAAATDVGEQRSIASALTPILEVVGAGGLSKVMDTIPFIEDETVRAPLIQYIDRVLDDHEPEVVARVGELPMPVAKAILAMLGRRRTPGALDALATVIAGEDVILRLEAIAQRAESPEELKRELERLADHDRVDVRLATLRSMADHRVRDLGPDLVRRMEDPSFHSRSVEERREFFRTLFALNEARAEMLSVEVLRSHGILVTDARERTRLIAAQMLGERGETSSALEALSSATKGWWWNSDELRHVAAAAAKTVQGRLEAAGYRFGAAAGEKR